jgi:carbamate kinase
MKAIEIPASVPSIAARGVCALIHGPKIRAVIEYLEGGGEEGIITDPHHLNPALSGKAGTRFVHR